MSFLGNIGHKLTGGLFRGDPSFDPRTTQIDSGMQSQWSNDINGVRNLASTPITGLSAAGNAGMDLANTAYQNQLQQSQMQNASGLATNMANVGRFGADSGSAERMNANAMRQGMIGDQQMGMANMQNRNNIAMQDLQQQQGNQFNALMALPSLQQGYTMADYGARQGANQAWNQAQAANQAAQMAGDQSFMNAGASLAGGFAGMGGMSGIKGLFS